MLRRQTNESWTDSRRNVMRKLVVQRGWVQKRMCVCGWSDEQKCRGGDKEEGTEKHRLYHCPSWKEVSNQIPEGLGRGRGLSAEAIGRKSHSSVRRWESEKHRSWEMQVEGFRGHVAADGSLSVSGMERMSVVSGAAASDGAKAWDVRYLGC